MMIEVTGMTMERNATVRSRKLSPRTKANTMGVKVSVMLLALVPAAGAVAYAVSAPMLKGPGRMLLDEAASRLPFKLYRRLGLARLNPGNSVRIKDVDA